MAESIVNLDCLVYALFSSADGEIRYIGQTKLSIEQRLAAHISSAKIGKTHRANWIRSVIEAGCKLEAFVLRPNAIWHQTEMQAISYYRKMPSVRLVNATAGGDGLRDPSMETREKIGAAHRGRKASLEARAAMSERARSVGISSIQRQKMIKGIRQAFMERGDEIRAKLRASKIGRVVSGETRQKIAGSLRGVPRTECTKRKLSASGLARFESPLERQRTSSSTIEGMRRPEVRAKLVAGNARRWSSEEERRAQAERASAHFAKPGARELMSEKKGALTAGQVVEARRLRAGGWRLKELCAKFGIGMPAMSMLCNGLTYKHLQQFPKDASAFERAGL